MIVIIGIMLVLSIIISLMMKRIKNIIDPEFITLNRRRHYNYFISYFMLILYQC